VQDRPPEFDGEDVNRGKDHEVVLQNRNRIGINGVLGVDSFDDREIVLQTDWGALVIRGEDLHIDEISLDSGNFTCTGNITGLQYASGAQSGRRQEGSWLKRLFY